MVDDAARRSLSGLAKAAVTVGFRRRATGPWGPARLGAGLLCGTLWMFPPSAGAQALALETAIRMAVERSPQLAAQRHASAAAREMAVAAGELPDPALRVGVENMPVTGPERFTLTRDFMTMNRVGVMQEWVSSDKREARRAAGLAEAEREVATGGVMASTIRRETAMAYLDRWYAEELGLALGALREEAAAQAELVTRLLANGRASQADVVAARMSVQEIEARRIDVRRMAGSARARLAGWIGEAAASSLTPPPELSRLPYDEQDLDARLERHPGVLAAQRQISATQAQARVAHVNRDPNWSWELAYSVRASPYNDMVSFGVSIPLPVDRASRQDRDVASRLAGVSQAQALAEETRRAVRQELTTAMAEWRARLARLEHYERELLPLSAERVSAALASYAAGAAMIQPVLEARRMQLDTITMRSELRRELAQSWALVAFAFDEDAPHADREKPR